MRRNNFRFLFTLLLLLTAPVLAQSDQIDSYIRGEMQKQQIPGLSIAVVKNGQIIKQVSQRMRRTISLSGRVEPSFQVSWISRSGTRRFTLIRF